MNDPDADSERVLVLALSAREASIAEDELEKAGLAAHPCADVDELSSEIERGAGAALLVEERISKPEALARLQATLDRQPPWSDFPILVVATRKRSAHQRTEPLVALGNVTLLDPPLRIRSLVRATHAAIRSRRRQYEARRAIVQRDRFLAMLGHELRNPLSAISMATEVLAQDEGNTGSRHLPIMRRQVLHLSRLVDDLLDVARITSGRIELQRQPVALSELIEDVVSTMRPRFEQAKITLGIDIQSSPVVLADPVRLEQAIANVLTNALKYTFEGGHVDVTLWQENADACVSIADDGAGIPAEMLPRIFDRFVQGESTLDRAQGGMGVGLALVRTLIELHGGSIRADSEGRGRGTVFTLRLPVSESSERAMGSSARRSRGTPGEERDRSRTILLVEDNDDARELLALALQRAGHEVVQAADGEEALEVLPSREIDVAIVDLGLPRIDGFEVARRVREDLGPDLLLIALSGYGQPEDRARALQAGFDVHLTKPTTLGQLRDILHQR